MIHRDDLPPTPEWVVEPREAPEFILAEVKMPALWEGDQA